jgi:hypothetical protein
MKKNSVEDLKKQNKKRHSFLSNIFVSHGSHSGENVDNIFDFTNISKSTSLSPHSAGASSFSESDDQIETIAMNTQRKNKIVLEENLTRKEENFEVKGFKDSLELFLEKRKKILELFNKSLHIVCYQEDLTNQISSNFMMEKKEEFSSYYDLDRIKISFRKNPETNSDKPIITMLTSIKKLKNEVFHKSTDKINGQKAPSIKHAAIATLVESGIIKHVITGSTQGQLKLAGIPPECLTEIFGNAFVEGSLFNLLTRKFVRNVKKSLIVLKTFL